MPKITKEQIQTYLMDCCGYSEMEVKEMLDEIKEFGLDIRQYLTSDQIRECINYSK